MHTQENFNLEKCLCSIMAKGGKNVRVCGTDENISVDEAIRRVRVDGTANCPACIWEPHEQYSLYPKKGFLGLQRWLRVHQLGHIMQVNGMNQAARFFYE